MIDISVTILRRWFNVILDAQASGRPAGSLNFANYRAVLCQKGYLSSTWYHGRL